MNTNSRLLLRVKNLMVFYENALAINNLSLEAREGDITGVFGMNSAGKSTLMYTISGIILDTKRREEMKGGQRISILGEITYNEEPISHLAPWKRAKLGIILCPERRRLFIESSVLENLRIGGYLASKAQWRDTLDYIFTLFPHLKRLKNRQAGFLSGGEQQMLAIGRALMAQPKLLLLDEPFLGLSLGVMDVLINAIRDIKDQRNISILISEQYARPLFPIINFGYIVENGNVVLEGESKELLENPDVKAAYFGV